MLPAAVETVVRPALPVDLRQTLGVFRRGGGDPACAFRPDGFWRATLTPDGVGTINVRAAAGELLVTAWGPGAEWLVAGAPDLLGARDLLDGFEPVHDVVREMHRRLPGLRVPRSGLVFDALLPGVLEQKVTGREAWDAWRALVRRHGVPAPGPVTGPSLTAPPAPEVIATLAVWDWHRAGVEARRAEVLRAAATRVRRLEETTAMTHDDARRRLLAFPGIGPWTAAEVAQRALGDTDAVSVGDYHLAKIVGHTLTGAAVDDDAMLELLAPYAGHRYRACRLIEAAGLGPPRRGPRMSPRKITSL